MLIAGIGLVAACASPTPTETPSQLPSLPPVPETPFPTGALDPALGWQRVDLGVVGGASDVSLVTTIQGEFLAVGFGRGGAAHSADGLTWTREEMTSTYGAPATLETVGDRLVVVGAGGSNRCAHPFAIDSWTRSADRRWTEAPWNPAFCEGLSFGRLLAWRGAAWLVASGSGDQPFDWSSVDGLHWTARGTVGGILPTAAAADGDVLLAFGQDETGAIAARRSDDGATWVPAPMAPVASERAAAAFVRSNGLQVFLDHAGRIDVLTRDATGVASIVQTTEMEGVDNAGAFVDVGNRLVRLAQDSDQLPVGWSSTDGVAWTPIQLPDDSGPGTTLTGVAVLDGTAVLVGRTMSADGSSSVGAIWAGSESLLGS